MKLTSFLWRKKMPNGHIWSGKHRLYRTVSENAKQSTRDQFAIEDANMMFLRHPYLSVEQSHGHAQALGKADQWRAKWREANLKFKEPVTLVQRLGHLRVKENWD